MGERIIVEPSRESRRRELDAPSFRPPPRGPPPRRGVKVSIVGIPSSTSWQDLKDYARLGNNSVMFADIDRNDPSIGVVEFANVADAEEAVAKLNDIDLKGARVTVQIDPDAGAGGRGFGGGGYGGGGPGGGYEDRRPPRDYGYDRPRQDDRRPPPPPRDYGSERPRRDDDRFDRRERSPPPTRGYGNRYDDRPPRNDDRPPRSEDRPPRSDDYRNGDRV